MIKPYYVISFAIDLFWHYKYYILECAPEMWRLGQIMDRIELLNFICHVVTYSADIGGLKIEFRPKFYPVGCQIGQDLP